MTPNKRKGLSGTDQVEEYLNKLEHEHKEEIKEIRNIILSVNAVIYEQIKWNAPSFVFEGEDRITFNLRDKKFIRLIFHCGPKVKDIDMKRLINDETGIVEWVSNNRAIVKFYDMNDVKAKESSLKEIVAKWIDVTVA